MSLNPHNNLVRAGKQPTSEERAAGAAFFDYWRCVHCDAEGTIADLESRNCLHDYPPCEHCGETPVCAPDCAGIMRLLAEGVASGEVYLAGSPE